MAEEQNTGGYQCQFVAEVPEELMCKVCKLAAIEPHTINCCGKKFCQACIDPVLKDKKPCPSCGEAEFSTLFIKSDKKKILALQVHCTMRQRGCGWAGQLEQLDAHLDPECQYVDVECPSKCDLKVQKHNLASHLEENCLKREFMCPYCLFKATYETVSNVHFPECLYFPLQCPNQCGVTCEREFIEDHMQMCPLEEVECELSYAGCKERFLRQDQDEHMQQNAIKHVSLTAAATLRISREFEQKLREKDQQMQELQEVLQEKDQQIKEVEEKLLRELKTRDEKHAAEMTALRQTDEQLHQTVNTLRMVAGVPPYYFTTPNYAELLAKSTTWDSEPFYTHPGGYKCCIRVNVLVCSNIMSVYLCSLPGAFDGTLPWPAKATITLDLLNQHRDQDHWNDITKFQWGKPKGITEVGFSLPTYHSSLKWNARKQTQYLKDDCLQFRVAKIELRK